MWGNGNGFGGYAGGNELYPWMQSNANTNAGFRDAMVNDGINGIRGDINGISTQLCNGFAGIEANANARQIANMQTAFAGQTAMAQGFNALQAQQAGYAAAGREVPYDGYYYMAQQDQNELFSESIRWGYGLYNCRVHEEDGKYICTWERGSSCD